MATSKSELICFRLKSQNIKEFNLLRELKYSLILLMNPQSG